MEKLTHFVQMQEKLKIDIATEDVKKLAKFAYDVRAKGQSHYPYSVLPRDEFKTAINTVLQNVNICPENVPVTSTELAAKPHVYIRALYEILKDLEPLGDIPVRKPMPITSRGWLFRKFSEKLEFQEFFKTKKIIPSREDPKSYLSFSRRFT
ncbi:hypothetical protein EC973_009403 [Apophysomyces ossiformis]|uniref:Uncharacterized protein n=1 Tax=Apophysomyces ossiformis TaxID=679940 RepID=A0A8H7BPA6_9FUNG|nr:hypothetical protein EC973_009403 [Apophysomyces ossiformis]